MSDELEPGARSALAAYGRAQVWTPARKQEVQTRIEASIEVAAPIPLDVPRTIGRVAVALAVAAGVVLAVGVVARWQSGTEVLPAVPSMASLGAEGGTEHDTIERAEAGADEPEGREVDPAPRIEPPEPLAVPEPVVIPPAADATRVDPPRTLEPTRNAIVPPARPSDTLAAEMAILKRARTALRSGDVTAALAELDAHAQRHARGQMAEDREALRVEVLCRADRQADAERAAESFARRWPDSPHAARVAKICTPR